MYICRFLFKEYFFFFQKLRTTPYSLVNLLFFYRLRDKSLKFSWFDNFFFTPTHKWCRLLTKLDFNMAFEIVPFISDRSQQFSSLYPYFTLAKTSLQQFHTSSGSHVPCRCCSLWRPLGWTPEPQLLTTQDMESAMKAKSSQSQRRENPFACHHHQHH